MNPKILYHNLRVGMSITFPMLAGINFLIISYSLTDIQKFISITVYAPIMGSVLVLILIFVGTVFKKKQMQTDTNEIFRNSPDMAKTLRLILEGEKDPQWIKLLKEIEDK